jgi:hypothetical protein
MANDLGSTLTLVLPYIVSAINEKMMYIFAAVNVISIPIGKAPHNPSLLTEKPDQNKPSVYALYPESNQRTLEEMDLLFAAPTPWAWDAERTFAAMKEEVGGVRGLKGHSSDVEAKGDSSPPRHFESI